MTETLGARVRRLREARELTQEQLASRVPGMSASAISQLEIGKTKGVMPQNLVDLARALNLTPEELVEGEDQSVKPKAAASKRIRLANGMRDVPIIGFAIANPTEDGYFDDGDFPPGAGEGYMPWPTKDANAYALRVRGDSMQPRIRAGEIIVVEPGASVIPGDDVVVRTKAGRKLVKQLLFRRSGEITLGSINSAHQPLTISLEKIESMHRVGAIVPRGTHTKDEPE